MMTNAKPSKLKEIWLKFKDNFSTPNKKRVFIRKVSGFIVKILMYVLMIGLCFIIIYPILLQLAVAFRAPSDVNNPTVLWIPGEFSTQNFGIAAVALDYWDALESTVILCIGTTLLQLISTALAGYAFARLKFKGSKILFLLAMLTIIVPQTVISLPLERTMSDFGLLKKPTSLFLMSILGMGIKSGIFIFLFRQFFRGIPIELEEAAYVDGANSFQVFYKVMLPNARGAIITVALLSFVWQWNDYFFTNLFISQINTDFKTLAVAQQNVLHGLQPALSKEGIWELIGQEITQNRLFSSMIVNTSGIIAMLPLLIMYFFVQKLFVEGIERSGIVG